MLGRFDVPTDHTACHDRPVNGPIEIRLRLGPGEITIGLTENGRRRLEIRMGGKAPIAAKAGRLPVLPKHGRSGRS
ncbi:MAG: hypothetical protein WA970_12970 [Gammaproteobacteria bacterium]